MENMLQFEESFFRFKKFQISGNPEKFIKDSLDDVSDVDMIELEENMANLENIIAAGASASNKRNLSKKWEFDFTQNCCKIDQNIKFYLCRHRSKSIISEDFNMSSSSPKENDRNYPLRRQSAISDFKPKVKYFQNLENFH